MTIFGADVSHYQNEFDVAKAVHEHNLTFLIAKVTEGQGVDDPEFGRFKADAERLGLLFSAYHWVRGDSSPGVQVDHVARVLKDKSIPIMLDVEATQGGNPAWSDARQVRSGLINRGWKVGLLYLPQWYWEGTLGRPKIPDNWALLQSDYGSNNGAYPGDISPRWMHGSRRAEMLQFTSKGMHLFGYHGSGLDVDAYRGSREQLAKTGWFKDYAKKANPVTPKPNPPGKPKVKVNTVTKHRKIIKTKIDALDKALKTANAEIPTTRPAVHENLDKIRAKNAETLAAFREGPKA